MRGVAANGPQSPGVGKEISSTTTPDEGLQSRFSPIPEVMSVNFPRKVAAKHLTAGGASDGLEEEERLKGGTGTELGLADFLNRITGDLQQAPAFWEFVGLSDAGRDDEVKKMGTVPAPELIELGAAVELILQDTHAAANFLKGRVIDVIKVGGFELREKRVAAPQAREMHSQKRFKSRSALLEGFQLCQGLGGTTRVFQEIRAGLLALKDHGQTRPRFGGFALRNRPDGGDIRAEG